MFKDYCELTFNVDVDISGFDPTDVSVVDQTEELQQVGGAPVTQPLPNVVRCKMSADSPAPSGGLILLTVNAPTGIVSAVGAIPWPGVLAQPIPF